MEKKKRIIKLAKHESKKKKNNDCNRHARTACCGGDGSNGFICGLVFFFGRFALPLFVIVRVFAQHGFHFPHVFICKFKGCIIVVVLGMPVFIKLVAHSHTRCGDK